MPGARKLVEFVEKGAGKKPPLVVWRFVDGKPGHENQSRGLVNALARLTIVEEYVVRAKKGKGMLDFLLGRFPPGEDLSDPDLIIGAGHATHWPMLAARRARGGRVVVLMKPSLPLGWFDRCIIPLHDGVYKRPNVIATRGMLNTIVPSMNQRPDRGLILVGGISKHYGWDEAALLKQIITILERCSEVQWYMTDSRRTPTSTSAALARLEYGNLQFISHMETPQGWVQTQLDIAARVWVTMDSVSMIYEALTAGGKVGLLELSAGNGDRICRATEMLVREKWLIQFTPWQQTTNSQLLAPAFVSEAERCAKEIMTTWFLAPLTIDLVR